MKLINNHPLAVTGNLPSIINTHIITDFADFISNQQYGNDNHQ